MFLSIIVPFYNSELKSDRLLNTISHLNFKEVEYIFVDDGSTDNTYKKLVSFRDSNPHHNISVLTQENKGPGGARNTGLKLANGKYVWFVDSDDDITSEAIEYLYANINYNYDFIEFIEQQSGALIDSMNIESGSYTESTQVRNILLKRFGRLHSKIFKRKLLIDNNILYPEYCYYEDNPLVFIYPFHVKSFLKTDIIGYIYQVEQPSITRGNQSPKKLDRLKTAEYGLKKGLTLASSSVETQQLTKEFAKQYLMSINLFKNNKPSKDWLMTWRILKQYRNISKDLNLETDPFTHLQQSSMKGKIYFYLHWLLSYGILTNQTKYFDNLRQKAWNIDDADL